jgi:hypothetical protein
MFLISVTPAGRVRSGSNAASANTLAAILLIHALRRLYVRKGGADKSAAKCAALLVLASQGGPLSGECDDQECDAAQFRACTAGCRALGSGNPLDDERTFAETRRALGN